MREPHRTSAPPCTIFRINLNTSAFCVRLCVFQRFQRKKCCLSLPPSLFLGTENSAKTGGKLSESSRVTFQNRKIGASALVFRKSLCFRFSYVTIMEDSRRGEPPLKRQRLHLFTSVREIEIPAVDLDAAVPKAEEDERLTWTTASFLKEQVGENTVLVAGCPFSLLSFHKL